MRIKLITIISLLFCVFVSNAQCNYTLNKIDPITDTPSRIVETRLTSPAPYYYFSFIRKGDDYKFNVQVGDYGDLDTVIPKGSQLVLRMGNGEVVRMVSLDEAKPKIVDDLGDRITDYNITFQMEEKTLRAIVNHGIMHLRIKAMANSFSDQNIPNAVKELSKSSAGCIFR